MKKIALFFVISLMLSMSTAFGYSDQATAYKILGTHADISSGNPNYVGYFFGTNKVIILYNLDRPDIQLIQKQLDFAFQNGKSIISIWNLSRNERKANWYDVNGAPANLTIYDVYSYDSFYFHVKN